MNNTVSFVLPCYNPPENWAENIIAHYGQLQQLIPAGIQVILVEDGRNGSIQPEQVTFLEKHIPQFIFVSYQSNKGKGHAIRQGVSRATGDYIIYTDIDFPYTDNSIRAIYAALKQEGADIAVGVKDGNYYKQTVYSRRIISKLLHGLTRFFLSIPITDTQCGLKGFQSHVKPLFLQTTINRYLFDLEFIRNAFRRKYTIRAIPVVLNEGIHIKHMNYRVLIPEVINFIKLLFK